MEECLSCKNLALLVPGGHVKFNEGSFILSSSGGIHGSISELKLQEKHSTSTPAILSLSKDVSVFNAVDLLLIHGCS